MLPSELSEYADLQGSVEMITKTELLQYVRDHGAKLGDRNLLYYHSEGLLPSAVRIGTRQGVYMAIAAEQALWLVRSRERGLSIEAIKQLLTVWKLLVRSRREQVMDVAEIEYVARAQVSLPEANVHIPWMISDVVHRGCPNCSASLTWRLKNGETSDQSDGSRFVLSFILGEVDEQTGLGRQVAWTQMSFPGMDHPNVDDPSTILLGVPNNIRIDADGPTPVAVLVSKRDRSPTSRSRQTEVLPLV